MFRKKIKTELKPEQTPKHYEMRQERAELLRIEKIIGTESVILYQKKPLSI